MRKCYICNTEKEETEFHKDRTQSGGISYDCKRCKSEIRKAKRLQNPEKYREQCRKSAKKNYQTIRKSQKKYRIENNEKINIRRRELREPRKAELNLRESLRRKRHRENDTELAKKERQQVRNYYQKNKEKLIPQRKAHQLVMFAVRLGLLKRPDKCEVCSSDIRVEGHHDDYTKPLEVRWLCKVCHHQADKERRIKCPHSMEPIPTYPPLP